MNEDEQNPLPPLEGIPEFLQGDNWFMEDTSSLYLDFSKPYKPPKWTLSHNGIPFAKLGDLHVIAGKSGHGKTALMSQFMACILSGSFGKLRYELKEVPKPVILYIDTEMSEDDTIAVKNRVCTLAGIDHDKPTDQLKIVRLRETEDATERWRQILKVIYEVKPTVTFLDGMLDIVDDYNDQKECQPIIRKCMKLVTHYNMSLWCVLHENPTADKMVGTLGSILQRKVTECFTVHKHKHDKNYPQMPDIFFSVDQVKARGKDQEDWCFQMLDKEGWGRPVELDQNGEYETLEDRKEQQLINEADERFKSFNWSRTGATYTELESYLHQQGVTSNRKKKALFDKALEKNIIYKSSNKKYHYNGLDKEAPDDQPADLPFDAPENNKKDAPF